MAVIVEQKEAARILGVHVRSIRDWMKTPGFPDCAGGYDIAAIKAWRQLHDRKGSDEEKQSKQLTLATKAQQLRIKKIAADKAEREEQAARGNILPRDEYTLAVREMVQLTRDRLLELPKQLCALVPKKYHRKLQAEGANKIRKWLDEFARGISEVSAD